MVVVIAVVVVRAGLLTEFDVFEIDLLGIVVLVVIGITVVVLVVVVVRCEVDLGALEWCQLVVVVVRPDDRKDDHEHQRDNDPKDGRHYGEGAARHGAFRTTHNSTK
jgi:hypothetical protein